MKRLVMAAAAVLFVACSPEVVYVESTPEVVYATPVVVYVTPAPTATPEPTPTPVSGCLDPRNTFVTVRCPPGVPDGSYVATVAEYVYCEKWEPYTDGVMNLRPPPKLGGPDCPDGWTKVP